ncbi:alpha/beta hydrolase-fold protein [Saccharopolyspora sp. NPDC003752]
MNSPWPSALAGRLVEHQLDSRCLKNNPLGDPARRPLWVYTPPDYGAAPLRRYPSIYVLQGFTCHLDMWHNRVAFRPTLPEAVDALYAHHGLPGAIVVYVDAWTSYGGSQFIDSPGTGNYMSYLCEDVVSFVDSHYRTLPSPAHRAISGKSSGGLGAMLCALLRPELFGGLASHAGDALYEALYLPDFAKATRYLRPYGGKLDRWWQEFQQRGQTPSGPEDLCLLVLQGAAAAFSPAADGTPCLPFDTITGQLAPEKWDKWLAWDPVRLVARHSQAARGIRAAWIDAGDADEYFLDLGATAFDRALRAHGVPDDRIRFEIFRGRHFGIEHRYPAAIAWLSQQMATH